MSESILHVHTVRSPKSYHVLDTVRTGWLDHIWSHRMPRSHNVLTEVGSYGYVPVLAMTFTEPRLLHTVWGTCRVTLRACPCAFQLVGWDLMSKHCLHTVGTKEEVGSSWETIRLYAIFTPAPAGRHSRHSDIASQSTHCFKFAKVVTIQIDTGRKHQIRTELFLRLQRRTSQKIQINSQH
jgi:hypothetical protein